MDRHQCRGPASGLCLYDRLSEILEEHDFDQKSRRCTGSSKRRVRMIGRASPGCLFRALLIGYFDGLDSERTVAWRASDSLSLRRFLMSWDAIIRAVK